MAHTLRRVGTAATLFSVLFLSGCHLDMWRQPKIKAQEQSDFFADGMGTRQPVANTIARGQRKEDELFYTGKINGQLANVFPFPITKEEMDRGQERFNVYCAPCHGRLGDGKGFIALRGQWRKPPANLQDQRLVDQPVGHFFDVITNGFGVMYSYASRIPVDDRWRIVAYVRALQYSQHASMADLVAQPEQIDNLDAQTKQMEALMERIDKGDLTLLAEQDAKKATAGHSGSRNQPETRNPKSEMESGGTSHE